MLLMSGFSQSNKRHEGARKREFGPYRESWRHRPPLGGQKKNVFFALKRRSCGKPESMRMRG